MCGEIGRLRSFPHRRSCVPHLVNGVARGENHPDVAEAPFVGPGDGVDGPGERLARQALPMYYPALESRTSEQTC